MRCNAPLAQLAEQLTLNQFPGGKNAGKSEGLLNSAAPGAAVDAENQPIPAELAAVIDAWPALPEAVKAGILAMVKATGAEK